MYVFFSLIFKKNYLNICHNLKKLISFGIKVNFLKKYEDMTLTY